MVRPTGFEPVTLCSGVRRIDCDQSSLKVLKLAPVADFSTFSYSQNTAVSLRITRYPKALTSH